MFNERLIDTLKEAIYWLKQIANNESSGGSDGGSDDGGSDDGGSAFAPLIVEGTLDDDGIFTPGLQQPTWNEAKEAFLSGTPVFLKVDSEGGGVFLIDALYPSGFSYGMVLGSQGAGYMWPETIPTSNGGGEA